MPKDTHSTLPAEPGLVLPERVTVALGELAGAAREGCSPSRSAPGSRCSVSCWTPTWTGWLAQGAATTPSGSRPPWHPARPGYPRGPPPAGHPPTSRTTDGTAEVPVPTWEAFSGRELLDQLTLERVLAKLSTRRYRAGLEPVGAAVEQAATGTSKSSVSRRFVAATEHAWPSCSRPT
jgi:putative transposase